MKFVSLIPYYVYWHYTNGVKSFIYNFVSILIFEYHFFSVGILFRTLFQPFQKVHEQYSNTMFDVKNFFTSLVINTIMRIIGFGVRSCLIIVYILATIATLLIFPILLITWVILPFALLFLLVVSIMSYLKYK
jgi:hypothetical protein